jgi:hypothetical protein
MSRKRLLGRLIGIPAALILILWLAAAAYISITWDGIAAFPANLALVAIGAGEGLKSVLLPDLRAASLPWFGNPADCRYFYRQSESIEAAAGSKVGSLRWSQMQVRVRGPQVYVAWVGVPSSQGDPLTASFAVDAEFANRHIGGSTWPSSSLDEWKEAAPVHLAKVDSEAGGGGRAFLFQGRTFQRTGSGFAGNGNAYLSPGGEAIALPSLSGPFLPFGLYLFDFTKRAWDLHVEIYEVKSQKLLVHYQLANVLSHGAPTEPVVRFVSDNLALIGDQPADSAYACTW